MRASTSERRAPRPGVGGGPPDRAAADAAARAVARAAAFDQARVRLPERPARRAVRSCSSSTCRSTGATCGSCCARRLPRCGSTRRSTSATFSASTRSAGTRRGCRWSFATWYERRARRVQRRSVTRRRDSSLCSCRPCARSSRAPPTPSWRGPISRCWRHGICPLCGGEPDFAVITPAADRVLICGRCSARWRVPPVHVSVLPERGPRRRSRPSPAATASTGSTRATSASATSRPSMRGALRARSCLPWIQWRRCRWTRRPFRRGIIDSDSDAA